MTSIEWLLNEIAKGYSDKGSLSYYDIIILSQKAKEMHKQEIIKANRDGVDMAVDKKPFIMGEQYYNETFNK